jgi:hypothetical protein
MIIGNVISEAVCTLKVIAIVSIVDCIIVAIFSSIISFLFGTTNIRITSIDICAKRVYTLHIRMCIAIVSIAEFVKRSVFFCFLIPEFFFIETGKINLTTLNE